MVTSKAIPERTPVRLHAVTRTLAHVPDIAELLSYTDPQQPLAWNRGDRGCVGVGEVLRLAFSGPRRFEAAAAAWRQLSAAATVDDPVRLPGSGLVAFGTFAFSDDDTTSVLIVPRLLIARHRGRAWVTEVATHPLDREPQLPPRREPGNWHGATLPLHDPDAHYLAGVREATRRITHATSDAPLDKVVLARQLHGAIPDADDLRVPIRRLTERYTDCWNYAVDGMIGASPETLLRQTDGAISARVLAGTRGRKPGDPEADARARDELLTSAKEQHEHAFAVQSVVTALSPHVQGLRTSEEPFALALPNVWHLATDLGAVPGDGGSSLELAAALHPTAAVAGTPTAAALAAISALEPATRGRYAGPIGWIDAKGEGEWVIALRCAFVGPSAGSQRPVTAYAGGGIVAGSDAEHEFGETVSKFLPVAEAFAP